MPKELTPKQRETRKANRVLGCAFCGAALGDLNYFCRPHFFELPGNERVALYAMHRRGQNVESKVAKLVSILRMKRAEVRIVAVDATPESKYKTVAFTEGKP